MATRGQELYRMGQDSPPSPPRPPAPGSDSPGGGSSAPSEVAGTRVSPNGKVLERASGYAAGFLQSVPGVVQLAQQMYPPAGAGASSSGAGSGLYSDINESEALELYRRMRGGLPPEQQQSLDLIAARLGG